MKSTSFHHLNADRHLSFAGKLSYFALNWINNGLPGWHLDPRLEIRDFHGSTPGSTSPPPAAGASPSRRLSDLFWMTLPWDRIQEELGSIRVLDVGCGRGEYGPRFLSWSGNRIDAYVGADVRARDTWPRLAREDARLRFIEADAVGLRREMPEGTNVILSQSTLEHLDEDLGFFEDMRDYARQLGRSALHVHLCPSRACLRLYLLHGVRQYTPRTLSKITRLFDDGYAVLFKLGGRACNRLHWRFITAPLMIRRTGDDRLRRPAEYERLLHEAIERDLSRPQRSPAFYALVIHTHPRRRLF